ncbi:MAG TPA: hypothetical protein VN800_01975 [Candidatus Acidoferrales bacterium]|nr:hypothetical protein [Candidatus Acidoferrales bacterium]
MLPQAAIAMHGALAEVDLVRELLPAWILGFGAGILLFGRGLLAYRLGSRVATIATSPLGGLAAGEVRVSGTVEPGTTILVSPLQSTRCIYYRSRVTEERGRNSRTVLDDARSVSFRLRDTSATVVVLPRGARWELDPRLDARSDLSGEPPSLDLNRGPAEEFAPEDHDAQVARLLTVRGAEDDNATLFERMTGGSGPGGLANLPAADVSLSFGGGRHYVESRVEPGDVVTIVATALPYSMVGPDVGSADENPLDDPEIADDLAAAQSTGTLRARPEDAWGNAAIPGFGIGRPVRTPALDPGAAPEPAEPPAEPLAASSAASSAASLPGRPVAPGMASGGEGSASPDAGAPLDFDVAPDELVLAAGSTGMTVYAGTPVQAAGSETSRFWQGVAGAALAVACAALIVLQIGAG